jgi:hypothetical protein
MPQRCDICGIAALSSQPFAEERLPFWRPKRYCPACHNKFYQRVYIVLTAIPFVLGCAGLVEAGFHPMRLLESTSFWFASLCLAQWLMILPHELGHAIAARVSGFTQLRILLGTGKSIFSIDLFGVPLLINLIPFGGATLFKEEGAPNRWKHIAVISAGPLVNLAAAALAWLFIDSGGLFDNIRTAPELVFWANLIVLAENIIPHGVQTPIGTIANDGMQIWSLLFRWNKPPRLEPAKVPMWEVIICQFLKWTVFLTTLSATILFGIVAFLPFLSGFRERTWQTKLTLSAIMVVLTLVAGWITIRIAKEPVARFRKPMLGGGLFRQASSWSREQEMTLRKACECAARLEFAQAEAFVTQVIATIADPNSISYAEAFLLKLQYCTSQNAIERAEQACVDFVNGEASTEQKIKILDGFVCQILYQPASPFLKNAERLARLALQIAPGTPTLKGSLGGVLAEQGCFTDAEPLLQACLDLSPALQDQGISSFYLGVVKLASGKFEEGQRLIKRGMILHSDPWLLAKAKARLKDLADKSGRA